MAAPVEQPEVRRKSEGYRGMIRDVKTEAPCLEETRLYSQLLPLLVSDPLATVRGLELRHLFQ